MKRLTLKEIKSLYENETREILDVEIRETGNKGKTETYIKYKCLIDEYEGWVSISNIYRGSGCLRCKNKIIHDGNRLSLLRPDLIKYFPNQKDADNYTVNSSKKVQLKCPECGMLKTKEVSILNLSRKGFSCDFCSDGISMPEKFAIYLFKQLGIDFETQKRFDWAKNKKYDIYFTLKNEEFICEINGLQHYEESKRGCTLIQQKCNDMLKYNLATQNGIKSENYIVIDARYSEFKWLRENFIKQLENIFDLSNVDWSKVWEDCQSSLVVKVCDAWNNRKDGDTTYYIKKMFGLGVSTVIKYLKIGNEVGRCKYNPKEEIKKNSYKSGKSSNKRVYQYSLDGYFIQSFESVTFAEFQTNILNISRCCIGKSKMAGGYKWSYNPPINGIYPD